MDRIEAIAAQMRARFPGAKFRLYSQGQWWTYVGHPSKAEAMDYSDNWHPNRNEPVFVRGIDGERAPPITSLIPPKAMPRHSQ